jgi:hypothetical protein
MFSSLPACSARESLRSGTRRLRLEVEPVLYSTFYRSRNLPYLEPESRSVRSVRSYDARYDARPRTTRRRLRDPVRNRYVHTERLGGWMPRGWLFWSAPCPSPLRSIAQSRPLDARTVVSHRNAIRGDQSRPAAAEHASAYGPQPSPAGRDMRIGGCARSPIGQAREQGVTSGAYDVA